MSDQTGTPTNNAKQGIAMLQTAHEIIRSFIAENAIDMTEFTEWFHDCRYPEEEANIHDSRYLEHLRDFVQERDLEREANQGI